MPEPLSILSGLSGAATTSMTFAGYIITLKNCPEDVKTCFCLVRRVYDDIYYALSLRTKHRSLLSQRQLESARIDSIIKTALESLRDIGVLVERVRADAGGKIDLVKKLRWVAGDSASFAARTNNLQAQHAAILNEISYLRNLDMVTPLTEALGTHASFENIELLRSQDYDSKSKSQDPESHLLAVNRYALHHVMSCETLVGSTFELDAGAGEEYTTFDATLKDEFHYTEREVISSEEDLEDAFFKDWKSQEEENRQRRIT